MPVNVNPLGDRVQLRVVVGTDPETGNPIYRSRSYSNVNPEADDQAVYNVAEGIGNLTEDSLTDVFRHKSFAIVPAGE